ncbi:MAG: 2-dehydropantoate 2-reductase [Candidatus Manganitrophaceae bacterium]|nr:MAG: 2-dehydropantoate 2-reductase [Candidatus Manganitrophaceae bacterium]
MSTVDPRPYKKILMVGAGAVGGYFGALLSRSGNDVTFLVRPKTYAAVSERGLQIKSVNGDFTVRPPLIQRASEIDSVDLIILAVKAYDLLSVLDEIAPLVERGATLLTLQNGVDSEERILSFFKKDCLVAGVAYITSRLSEPGVIEHYKRGMISLGELSGEKSDRAGHIHQLLASAGITCYLTGQIMKAKWEKLCWNATFNPLSVILDHPISLILDSAPLLEIVRQGISEVIAVAAAEGIELKANIIDETITGSNQFRDYHTSMYEDFKSGKPTEIEHLNGDLVRRGERRSIPVPTHRCLYGLVKGLEIKRGSGKER